MTREEAIEFGKMWLEVFEADKDSHTYEFFDMAIKALEQKPCDDAISRQAVQDYIAKYLSQYLYEDVRQAVEVIDEYIGELPSVNPQEPKADTWSIKEVADTLVKHGLIVEQEPFNIETYCKEHFMVLVDKDVWEKAEKALKQEPKTEWMPVSERLPEEHEKVIVTDIETSETYQSQYIGNGYWECDNGYFNNRIVAWMPFPKSYKAESEEI